MQGLSVPEVGLEPTLPKGNWILSPARLPISPLRHDFEPINLWLCSTKVKSKHDGFLGEYKVIVYIFFSDEVKWRPFRNIFNAIWFKKSIL